METADIEKEALYKYYSSAPIYFAFTEEEKPGLGDLMKSWNDRIDMKIGDVSGTMMDAFIEASEMYENVINNDIKVKFNEFDTDGSGGIDKAELKELSKRLGHEIPDEDLDEALKNLDLDGSGIVDIHEFAIWYFSGMKFENLKHTKMSISPE